MSNTAAIIFVALVLPLFMLLHYITRWRESKGLSKEDEKMLEDLWESAQRMESRLNALETILDDEVPEWRKKV